MPLAPIGEVNNRKDESIWVWNWPLNRAGINDDVCDHKRPTFWNTKHARMLPIVVKFMPLAVVVRNCEAGDVYNPFLMNLKVCTPA
jgi:hypothetical protein